MIKKQSNLQYHALDLQFQKVAGCIASFAIPIQTTKGKKKWILIESGPYSCYKVLVQRLHEHGVSLADVEKVFITHIHLDHSGGAWALAEAGASVYVHPFGVSHLIDPTKLYESAKRIYQEKMEVLWSKVAPISKSKVFSVGDKEEFFFMGTDGEKIKITAHHTPGHASHHIAWQVNNVLFSGDVCGIILNEKMLEVPAPPPEFHLGQWVESIAKIRKLSQEEGGEVNEIALTHFGSYNDVARLLYSVENRLKEVVAWFRGQVRDKTSPSEFQVPIECFEEFLNHRYLSQEMSEEEILALKNINPPGMTVQGVLRYLKKFKKSETLKTI